MASFACPYTMNWTALKIMLPSRQRTTTSPTPQRGHEALVESTESFPLDGLLDAIRHTRVKGIGSTLGLQT